jgi:alkylated DNA repair dioxygenase AlkB
MKPAPIEYIPNLFSIDKYSFDIASHFWNTLNWVRVGSTPRKEYYCNDIPEPYTYGSGAGVRTYEVQPWTIVLEHIQDVVQRYTGSRLEVCFVNGYKDNRDWLGWHADDSPEMDDERPIVIVSFGAERAIRFAEKDGDRNDYEELILADGSICIMKPGMQDSHVHMIPKSGNSIIKPRVSLTFRGYKK